MILPGRPLTDADLAKLAACGIPQELADRARLRRVDSAEGAVIVGRNGAGDYAGVIFPYTSLGEEQVREFRLRRDTPEIEFKDGKLHERNKYLSPPGRGNMLYLVPGTPGEWLKSSTLPAVVTEGEKKTLCLWALAHYGLGDAAETPRFLPIGLPGVWNWRGTVGKTSGPDGSRRDVKGTISDLDRIAWKSRGVTIVFDANASTNESVAAARVGLAKELTRRGAKVSILDLPSVEGVNGIDDLTGKWGPDRVIELFRHARPWNQASKAKQYPAPEVLTVSDLLRLNTLAPEMLIEDTLPRRGASLVAGMQKSGKTLFAVQSAVSVATGAAMFGCYRVLTQGAVMIIEQDDPAGAASVKDILQRSNVPETAPIYFVPCLPFSLGPAFVEWLEGQIRNLHLVLAVLDSYTSLRSARGSGGDIVKAEHAEMTLLDGLGKRANCLVELVHHESKGSAALDWSAKAGGTFAMTMATESLVSISRFGDLPMGAGERLVRIRGRHMEDREMVLRLKKETLNYEHLLEGGAASLYPVLVQLHDEFGLRPFSPKDYCHASGLGRTAAHHRLNILHRAGALSKSGHGEYRLSAEVK
jgi:hypothetical protein